MINAQLTYICYYSICMKKSLSFYFLIFFSILSATAQTNTDFNYNIGVNFYKLSQIPQVNFNQRVNPETGRYFPGIILKFNDNQLAYRVALNFYRNSNFGFSEDDSASVHGTYLDYSLKMGVERDLSATNFKPYFGADLGFLHSEFSGLKMHFNDKTVNNLRTEKNGFLISPFLGVKYHFIRRLYLSAEVAIDFIYAYNRLQTINDGIKQVSHFNKGEFLLAPVSLIGLHYNFGALN